LIHNYK